MKKWLALVMILMLLGVCALAEPMTYTDYTDDILEDGSPIYYFPELSLKLPADWRGKVMAMPGDNGTSFYQIASYEKYQEEGLDGGGFLFMLGVSNNGSFSELPRFQYLGYSEASSMNYYLLLPTDYPAYFEEDIRAEYDAMMAEVDYVAEHVEFYDVSAFTTDDGDSSHPEADSDMGEAGPPAQAAEPEAAGDAGVPLDKARYYFEHSSLPRLFYEAPDNVLQVLSERSVYDLWTVFANENGVAYPYQAEDFSQNRYDMTDGTGILQVVMPAPETTPLCYRIYLLYNAETGKAGYYTVEYENLLGESAMLCGWTEAHEHVNYGGAMMMDADSADYGTALLEELRLVAAQAGVSDEIEIVEDGWNGEAEGIDEVETTDDGEAADDAAGLAEIPCPEQGFTTMADPAYSWDYQEGTGITIYTEEAGRIPYVIVYQGNDLLMEPFEYIREQYTPHIQDQYGDDLVAYVEYETYDVGGKQLPAGLYTYRLQGHLVELLRIYDSTGARTVCFTAKYLQDKGDATLAALDAAVRHFKAD